MNVIKVKFIKDGEPKGQAYTYYSKNELELGELVEVSEGKKGCVVEINVPSEEIEKFGDTAKTIKGAWVEPQNQLIAEIPQEFDNQIIVVKQLPIIEEHLKALSIEIEGKVKAAKSLVCTEETVKDIKATRSGLNTQFKELETQRKLVKTAVLEPYEAFENIYKQYVSNKFKSADADLKGKIDEVESKLKDEKASKVSSYFEEYAKSKNIEFLQPSDAKINITLSESLKSLKARVAEFIDRVSDDLALIETQECKAEIFVEYKKTLNCSQAITTVASRHEAIEKQKKVDEEATIKRKEREEAIKKVEAAAPTLLEPPKQAAPILTQTDPIKTLNFKVTAPLSRLRELKKFLEDGGYTYE